MPIRPEAGKEPWFNAVSTFQKVCLLDFAAIIIFMLKFKVCYLPDYALSYLDINEASEMLYGDYEKLNVLRSNSSLIRQNSLKKRNSKGEEVKEESKRAVQL